MDMQQKPEVWQRGPVDGIIILLQPVAHALLQAQEEVQKFMTDFPFELLWQKPFGMASAGFHVKHIAGVINRLFTYAAEKKLTDEQLTYLANEEEKTGSCANDLLKILDEEIVVAINILKNITPEILTDKRIIGRKKIPTTVIGLYVHAAEHTMRHTGQLIVTASILRKQNL